MTKEMAVVFIETFIIGIGTYLLRAGSVSFGSKVAFPKWIRQWLTYVTPAVLGALLGPALFMTQNHLNSIVHDGALWAAVPTIIVAWFRKNLLLSVATGVMCFALISFIVS